MSTRMIDANDVEFRGMAFLKHADGSDYTPYERGYNDAIISCVHRVDNAPTIEVPRWIPVTERLPEKTGKYIVCTSKGTVYCTKFYTKRFGTDSNTHITHWMPLPTPPKDGE